MRLFTKLGIYLLFTLPCFGATWQANSVARSDVESAYLMASNGDTVLIPPGTATWTNTLTISKAITLMGSGTNSTIILDGVIDLGNDNTQGVLRWLTPSGTFPRMTGIQIGKSRTTYFTSGCIQVQGVCANFRLDHCLFNEPANEHILVGGGVYGVIDHCEFNMTGLVRAVMFKNGGAFAGANGDGSWENPVDWGGPGAIYIEDCVMRKPTSFVYGTIDGWTGGRVVIRYCTISTSRLGNHGTESAQRLRSGRSFEIYNCTISDGANNPTYYIDVRGGGALIHDNTFTGPVAAPIHLNAYRTFSPFPPWGAADGTMLWDVNTGIVYDRGISTGGASAVMTDTSKAWTVNQWHGYTLRVTNLFTAIASTAGTATVSGVPWTVNQWSGWQFTRVADNSKGYVLTSTANTLTLDSRYYRPDMTGGGQFVLSQGREITSNTANSITVINENTFQAPHVWVVGDKYEIRKVDQVLDNPGMGISNPILGSPPNHQTVNQGQDPIYQWNNTINGVPFTYSVGSSTIQLNREYYNSAKPGYTPYTYPHPLTLGVTNTPPDLVCVPPSNLQFVP